MAQPSLIETILSDREIVFDPSADNNGLYLCLDQSTVKAGAIDEIVQKLREAGAWHGETKTVSAEMKPVYAAQLAFEEGFATTHGVHAFFVLRAGNPKYPTLRTSWEKWRACLIAA